MSQMPKYLNTSEIAAYLGVGLSTAKRLCQLKPHGFPVVLVGNRYQADAALLEAWRQDWFSGKFTIGK